MKVSAKESGIISRVSRAAILATLATLNACNSGPDVVFVPEHLDVDGEPKAILRLVEDVEADVSYYDGSEWIIAEDVTVPAGWLIATPKLAEPRKKGKE